MTRPKLTTPCEEFTFSFRQGLVRFLWSAPATTTIFAGIMATILGVLGICMTLGGGAPAGAAARMPFTVLKFFAYSWCFCGLVTFPLSFIYCLFGRTRRIWVEGDQIRSRVNGSDTTIDLSESCWRTFAGTSWDKRGFYRGSARPRLAVRKYKTMIGLGFTEEAAAQWIAFLETAGVPRSPRIRWPSYLMFGVVAALAGGAIGLLLERLMPMIGGPPIQPGTLAFIGVLDATMLMVCLLARRYRQGKLGRRYGAFLMALLFAAYAIQWGGDAWQIFGTNAAIGAIGGWLTLPRDA